MAGIDADYVEVADRIQEFYAAHPKGSLQGEATPVYRADALVGWIYKARAYRSPEDQLPGVGHAWEPVPGLTAFTKGSELMVAETSAWGRAIVAVGIRSKKVASANEVRNRTKVAAPTAPATVRVVTGGAPAVALMCPRCGSASRDVPAGTNKAGKPYDAFVGCTNRECKWIAKPAEPGVPAADPVKRAGAPVQRHAAEEDDPGYLASLEASIR